MAFKVFDEIKAVESAREHANKSSCSWEFLGHPVCFKAWKQLHGLGHQALIYIPLCSWTGNIISCCLYSLGLKTRCKSNCLTNHYDGILLTFIVAMFLFLLLLRKWQV